MGTMFFNGKQVGNASLQFLQQEQTDWEQRDAADQNGVPNPDYIHHKPPVEATGDVSVQMTNEDNPNSVRGSHSAAFGGGNRIADGGEDCFAGGSNSVIRGGADGAVLGRHHVLKGIASAAIGDRDSVSADAAVALGYGLIADTDRQIVAGRMNASNPSAVFIVGNGGVHRSNAFTVQEDGTITLGGYYTEGLMISPVAHYDFSDHGSGDAIGMTHTGSSTVVASAEYPCNEKNTALFTCNTNATAHRAQANLTGLVVEAGKTYDYTMMVYSPAASASHLLRYWLCVMPSGKEDVQFADMEATNLYLVADDGGSGIDVGEDQWAKVSVTFTANTSGVLRLGVAGEAAAGCLFAVGDIIMVDKSLPHYDYASEDGVYRTTLYRIGDVQCDDARVAEWLSGRVVSTVEGTRTLTLADVNVDETLRNGHGSTIVTDGEGEILLCVVDSITPNEMEVEQLGVYAAPSVVSVDYRQWVDVEYNGESSFIPFINDDGNWQIGINDTGVKARGDDGVSITNAFMDGNELVLEFSNGDYRNLGNIRGPVGETGPQGEKGDDADVSHTANALMGKVEGAAVVMDDVSPIAHELSVTVTGDAVEVATVTQYGKNLFDADSILLAASGWSVDENGVYSGKALELADGVESIRGFAPLTQYAFSLNAYADVTESQKQGTMFTFTYTDGTKSRIQVNSATTKKYTFVSTAGKTISSLSVSYGYNIKNYLSNIQLEVGGEVTPYEPYTEIATAAVDADGTVKGLVSHYPTTTLLVDKEGAIITCEYNKDLNKAYDALVQAIISLGGNV